ncbi:MAG: DNA-directed RNA polymerase [Candidatus Odinarchaeia archaeon]
MYKKIVVKDVIRIPPKRFNEDLKKVALELLRNEYEGVMLPDLGFVITVIDVNDVGVGRLIPGDGATYHDVEFSILTFKPTLHEIVEGDVVEVVDFGAFIRLGPLDGLCHVSQITDDYINYDAKRSALIGKESGRVLTTGDKVRCRIIALSMRSGSRSGKIGLTMRQPFLGKLEWIKQELSKKKTEDKEKKETSKE